MNNFMLKIHPELLDKNRLKIFNQLAVFENYGYLGGGTALSLQILHRKSFDFDIFVKKPISNQLRLKIKKVWQGAKFSLNTSDQLNLKTKDAVDITFVWYYFQPFFPEIKTSSISLASVFDIAADKAYTIGRRAAWRDYVDLFFLLQKKLITLDRIINLAKKKFSGEFNETLFLQQLSYFKDVTITPIEFIDKSYEVIQIQSFLEKQVEDYLKIISPVYNHK